ncbi:hypothetical protein FA95DRAFT_1611828 [Auriscalpium vulgare]|uniref:Uncharacterized protein n=1 Tax=Auriscalpium vulgare TaxID=40419 RepID=A0ACB8R8Z0_9AGAM|nr:hypothetical protein FA95DRAFT_1611828 [Auriscalpium vulgare]
MPNSLTHIILAVDVDAGPIIVDILIAPNGTVSCTWERAPSSTPSEQLSPLAPAGGPPVVRTVELALDVAGDANQKSRVDIINEEVVLVQAAKAFFEQLRRAHGGEMTGMGRAAGL